MGVSHFGGSMRETSWRRENRNRVSTVSTGVIGLINLGSASSSKNTKGHTVDVADSLLVRNKNTREPCLQVQTSFPL